MQEKFPVLKNARKILMWEIFPVLKKMQSEFTADKIIVSKYNKKTGELFLS